MFQCIITFRGDFMSIVDSKYVLESIILDHQPTSNRTWLSLFEKRLRLAKFNDETIRKYIDEYMLLFCNHYVESSDFIMNATLAFRDQFFYYLFIYLEQFYSDTYLKVSDCQTLKRMFIDYHYQLNRMADTFLEFYDLEALNSQKELINKILHFYRIIEEFMIRYYNYSVIGTSDQKVIITACSNCDRKFYTYLTQGYSILRYQKIFLAESLQYEFLPVLPTRDLGFPVDEYVEVVDDKKIGNQQFVKVLQ